MTYSAVSTTGIYCWAGCAARPHPRNVNTYPTPVAAEAAGYRPCLRCRPDRLPEPHLDRMAPRPVAQALLLITDGYLDRHDEDQLASAVGYSSRQLRRLFLEHVGATPVFVARSRRAHFARRLLDETDLPMEHISAAAGFSSTRQLHRTMLAIFGFAPTELRRRRRSADSSAADGGLRLRIPFDPPVDTAGFADYLGPRATPGVEEVVGTTYRRTIVSCGYPGVVELDLGSDDASVELTAHLPTFATVIDDVARARHLLGLEHSRDSADALAQDELLGPVLRARPGLCVPGCWDRFEGLVRIVLGQQVSVAAASTVAGRVAARAGTVVEGLDDRLTVTFPAPEALAEADLENIGMVGRRAETVRRVARAVADGELDLFLVADLDELVEMYTALAGIGPWTAHLAALRLHRDPDAFPASDLGLRRGAALLLGHGTPLTTDELTELAERWRPHRAL
ncbi:MAG: helix-turn-helix domain-containing protein, partial [Acidimicrobiia bacterium]|nr:helix-turn-helix domain-containing protein [Acidimicrobiia bacterium]